MNENNEYALQAYQITKKLKNGKVLLDNISVNIKKNTFDGIKYTIPTPKLEYISNTVWGLPENWIVLLVSSIAISILCYFCLRRSIKD